MESRNRTRMRYRIGFFAVVLLGVVGAWMTHLPGAEGEGRASGATAQTRAARPHDGVLGVVTEPGAVPEPEGSTEQAQAARPTVAIGTVPPNQVPAATMHPPVPNGASLPTPVPPPDPATHRVAPDNPGGVNGERPPRTLPGVLTL